jgi:hypothetical protein
MGVNEQGCDHHDHRHQQRSETPRLGPVTAAEMPHVARHKPNRRAPDGGPVASRSRHRPARAMPAHRRPPTHAAGIVPSGGGSLQAMPAFAHITAARTANKA